MNKYIVTLGTSVFASIAASATDICTADEFVANLAADPAGSYTLTADINLTGVVWQNRHLSADICRGQPPG